MKRRAIIMRREHVVAIARAAAFVPVPNRQAFLKGILQSLRGLSRPDADVIAQAIFTQWRLAGVLPRPKPKPGFNPAYRKAA